MDHSNNNLGARSSPAPKKVEESFRCRRLNSKGEPCTYITDRLWCLTRHEFVASRHLKQDSETNIEDEEPTSNDPTLSTNQDIQERIGNVSSFPIQQHNMKARAKHICMKPNMQGKLCKYATNDLFNFRRHEASQRSHLQHKESDDMHNTKSSDENHSRRMEMGRAQSSSTQQSPITTQSGEDSLGARKDSISQSSEEHKIRGRERKGDLEPRQSATAQRLEAAAPRLEREEATSTPPSSHHTTRYTSLPDEHGVKMPGPLKVDTSPGSRSQSNASGVSPGQTQQYAGSSSVQSRSASPVRPPVEAYSPITPTMSSATLATALHDQQDASEGGGHRQSYTFVNGNARQRVMPQPPPEPIDFEDNPDVIALQATMQVLLMQKRLAEEGIRTLNRTKERVKKDPEGFVEALKSGAITTQGDDLYNPKLVVSDDEDDGGDEEPEHIGEAMEGVPSRASGTEKETWEHMPARQNVVRMPAINWNKYGIVGESLDKLHADQLARPEQGAPQAMMADGTLRPGIPPSFMDGGSLKNSSSGNRRDGPQIAAPYDPLRDIIIEKKDKKKGVKN